MAFVLQPNSTYNNRHDGWKSHATFRNPWYPHSWTCRGVTFIDSRTHWVSQLSQLMSRFWCLEHRASRTAVLFQSIQSAGWIHFKQSCTGAYKPINHSPRIDPVEPWAEQRVKQDAFLLWRAVFQSVSDPLRWLSMRSSIFLFDVHSLMNPLTVSMRNLPRCQLINQDGWK